MRFTYTTPDGEVIETDDYRDIFAPRQGRVTGANDSPWRTARTSGYADVDPDVEADYREAYGVGAKGSGVFPYPESMDTERSNT
jgi:hypothetical protein